jgi:hypothetical protein
MFEEMRSENNRLKDELRQYVHDSHSTTLNELKKVEERVGAIQKDVDKTSGKIFMTLGSLLLSSMQENFSAERMKYYAHKMLVWDEGDVDNKQLLFLFLISIFEEVPGLRL